MQEHIADGNEKTITCFKCHGKKFCNVSYVDDDDCNVLWNPRPCEICHGIGKISLKNYESLQRKMRENEEIGLFVCDYRHPSMHRIL